MRTTVILVLTIAVLTGCKTAEQIAHENRAIAERKKAALPPISRSLKTFVCTKDLQKEKAGRRFSFEGYLQAGMAVSCAGTCNMLLRSRPSRSFVASGKEIGVSVPRGSGPNQVSLPPMDFKMSNMQFFDQAGKGFDYRQRVRVTGVLAVSFSIATKTKRTCKLLRPTFTRL